MPLPAGSVLLLSKLLKLLTFCELFWICNQNLHNMQIWARKNVMLISKLFHWFFKIFKISKLKICALTGGYPVIYIFSRFFTYNLYWGEKSPKRWNQHVTGQHIHCMLYAEKRVLLSHSTCQFQHFYIPTKKQIKQCSEFC